MLIDLSKLQQAVNDSLQQKELSRKVKLNLNDCNLIYRPMIDKKLGNVRLTEMFIDEAGVGTLSYLEKKGSIQHIAEYSEDLLRGNMSTLAHHSGTLVVGLTASNSLLFAVTKSKYRDGLISKDMTSPNPVDWVATSNHDYSLFNMIVTAYPHLLDKLMVADTIGIRMGEVEVEDIWFYVKKGDMVIPHQLSTDQLSKAYKPLELYVKYKNKTQEVLSVNKTDSIIGLI